MAEIHSAPTSFTDELLAILRNQSYRDPLLSGVRSGQITREGMKRWAIQALFYVKDFTRFLSAIHSNCPHQDARLLLAENIWEEHGCGIAGQDHYTLLKRLAKSLGATDHEVDNAEPLPETVQYIEFSRRVTRESNFIESMTAIGIGIEIFMPKFFGELADAIKTRFSLSDEDVAYLQVHVAADDDHAQRAIEIINRYADSEQIRETAKQALRESLTVKNQFASAVYSHCLPADQ
jgi:pyrroloquinoline-quinone synthase